jgi:transposase InsO family protein
MQQPDTSKLMFHSDQGVQYSAELFKKTLSVHDVTQSMSRRGNCWYNSAQEQFFRSLKSEYLNCLSFIAPLLDRIDTHGRTHYPRSSVDPACASKISSSAQSSLSFYRQVKYLRQSRRLVNVNRSKRVNNWVI